MEPALIVTLICALISAVVGPVTVVLVNHRLKKQDEENKRQLEEAKKNKDWLERAYNEELRKERLEDFTSVITPFKTEMRDSIYSLHEQLNNNTVGTITLLRDRMKCSLNYCQKQGYATATDKANWIELYNSYKDLGGNHFREYVDQWKAAMEALPTDKVKKTTKNK